MQYQEGGQEAVPPQATNGVILVAGPPCGGKTTYVKQWALPQDPILDWDAVWVELHGDHTRPHSMWTQADQATEMEFRRRFEAMAHGWVIRCAPSNRHRAVMRDLKHARSIVLATPIKVCLSRLEEDLTRTDKPRWEGAIRDWWVRYRPSSSPDETVLGCYEIEHGLSSDRVVGLRAEP